MRSFVLLLVLAIGFFFIAAFIITGLLPGEIISESRALFLVILISASLALSAFLFGLITDDYSWVNRLWSTAPILYAWIYALKSGLNGWSVAGAFLVTIWGARLTYNFARKGGYSGTEDYRWPILKEKIAHPFFWQLFNLLFISMFQIGLFILFTAPAVRLSGSSQNPRLGIAAAVIFLAFLLIETVADQQQWNFHKAKHRAQADGSVITTVEHQADISRGFLSSGLFSLVRHPNYLGELGVWWSFFLFGAAHGGYLLHWSLTGPVVLSILFYGSTWFTESITAGKYPEYADYQARVPAIVPIKLSNAITQEEEV
jgi:steroid 5-alpha reductase family enzyme